MYNSIRRLLAPKIIPLNTIEISRSNILHNLGILERLAWDTVFPVLKSNAYGHGLQQVSSVLSRTNVPYICVDSFPEYQIVRRRAKKPVLVLGETNVENYRLYKADATLAVSSLQTLRALIEKKKSRKIHLFLNTWMHREWLQIQELKEALVLLQQAKHIEVDGVMSHLACADDLADVMSAQQVSTFHDMFKLTIHAWFSPNRKHIANSAGITKVRDPLFNASRAWIALYGYSPLQKSDILSQHYENLRPALRIVSTVVATQTVLSGESISYGATYTAGKKMVSATIPFGYYEGLPRVVSNQWMMRRNDHLLPQRGRICMNLCCIDTCWLPITKGDRIEIISPNLHDPHTIQHVADLCGTISYEVLVKFSEKTRRTVVV